MVTNPGQVAKAIGDFVRPGLKDPMSSPLLIHPTKWRAMGEGIGNMFDAAAGNQGPRAQGSVLGEAAAAFALPGLKALKTPRQTAPPPMHARQVPQNTPEYGVDDVYSKIYRMPDADLSPENLAKIGGHDGDGFLWGTRPNEGGGRKYYEAVDKPNDPIDTPIENTLANMEKYGDDWPAIAAIPEFYRPTPGQIARMDKFEKPTPLTGTARQDAIRRLAEFKRKQHDPNYDDRGNLRGDQPDIEVIPDGIRPQSQRPDFPTPLKDFEEMMIREYNNRGQNFHREMMEQFSSPDGIVWLDEFNKTLNKYEVDKHPSPMAATLDELKERGIKPPASTLNDPQITDNMIDGAADEADEASMRSEMDQVIDEIMRASDDADGYGWKEGGSEGALPEVPDEINLNDAADYPGYDHSTGKTYGKEPVVDKDTWGQTAYSVENIDPTIEGRERWNISDRYQGKNTEFQDWFYHDDEMFSRRSADSMPPGDAENEIARINSGSGVPSNAGRPDPWSLDEWTPLDASYHGKPGSWEEGGMLPGLPDYNRGRVYPNQNYNPWEEVAQINKDFYGKTDVFYDPPDSTTQNFSDTQVASDMYDIPQSYTWYDQTRFRDPPDGDAGGGYDIDPYDPDEPYYPDADPDDLDDHASESWKF